MLKPSALASLVAFLAVIVFQLRRKPKRLATHAAAAIVGAAIPEAVTLFYLIGSDLLGALPIISRMLARYAAQSQWDSFNWIKWEIVLVTLGFPILVRGLIFRRERDRVDRPIDSVVLMYALLWIAIEAAGVTMQGRMYKYHFLVLTPAAALLFGMLPRGNRPFPLIAALSLPLLLSTYGAIPTAGEISLALATAGIERLSAGTRSAGHSRVGRRHGTPPRRDRLTVGVAILNDLSLGK